MKFRTFLIVTYLLYVLILCEVAFCQEELVPTTSEVVLAEESAARQLRIYREALQQGSTEDIRLDAAVGLLLENSDASRVILITALKSQDNASAQGAICKALIKSRGLSQKIEGIDEFMDPLLEILNSQSNDPAKLAAEALLLYKYADIRDTLSQMVSDPEFTSKQRLNAIYAFQLRSEPSALRELIALLDDPDVEVSKAAETALQEAFGIPVGTSRKVWADILIELKLKSPEEIRKDRLLRQEMKLREVQTERDKWQKLYLASLDKQYEPLDEAERSNIVLEKLSSDLYPVRIWALGKAAKFSEIGDEIREKLLMLLSDVSREVRLEAAKVFANMSALNPAETLLEQFDQEQDAEVRLAMFKALGEAVFFAFLPDSKIDLPLEVKTETLSIATDYLNSNSGEAVIIGAEVVRKVIELNNLGDDALQEHLSLLLNRFKKSVLEDEAIQANLLSILARLCGQGGAKEVACRLFEPLFVEALTVKDDPDLRLAAAQGLSYVDKVKALKLYKKYDLIQDESLAIKQVVVDLAGQTGDSSDLDWLVGLLADNGLSESAWNAIQSICQRQDSIFLINWLETLNNVDGTKDEYILEILDIARQKVSGKNNTDIQGKIILWFWDLKVWEDGAAFLEEIEYPQKLTMFPENINAAALVIYLNSGIRQGLAQAVENKLLIEDFDPQQPGWVILDQYFESDEVEAEDKRELFEILDLIQSEKRPVWSAYMDRTRVLLESADPNTPEDPVLEVDL